MAWFTYSCPTHGEFRVGLPKREKALPCRVNGCIEVCKNVVKSGSVSIMERLDNGAMARAVERLSNIEEIMNDRADKHASESEGE
jgi:hypothetical protein